jgi:hypothetical protein
VEFEDLVEVVGDVEGMLDFVADVLGTVVVDETLSGVGNRGPCAPNSPDKLLEGVQHGVAGVLDLLLSGLLPGVDVDGRRDETVHIIPLFVHILAVHPNKQAELIALS